MLDIDAYQRKLSEACERYEATAPTVHARCDDLYRRINADSRTVTLAELFGVSALWMDGWMQPNHAANAIYHVRDRLGMDITGQAGF